MSIFKIVHFSEKLFSIKISAYAIDNISTSELTE